MERYTNLYMSTLYVSKGVYGVDRKEVQLVRSRECKGCLILIVTDGYKTLKNESIYNMFEAKTKFRNEVKKLVA